MIEVDRSGVARSPEWRTVLRESELRYERMLEKQNWTPATSLPAKVMIKHAALAFSELEAALKIDSEDALYHLGLASLTEQIVDWVAGEKKARVPAALRTLTYGRARDSYLRAFRAAYIKDRELKNLPDGGVWKFLSYEAGRGFLRLFDRDHERLNGDKDAVRAREEIDAALKKFESLRVDENSFILVSPIVVSLQAIRRLDELLAQEVTVDFDLMGHGPKHRWPWIRPTAGLLVWDPEKSGEITSARQLFGSYTFQIFRATGYEALAALDDDGDGFLRGAELRGVRVWFDTNSDGRSEPSEVHDLAALGIEAVAVRATGYDGIHPTCSAGILLSNGETLPTWDWMVSPIKE